MPVPLTLKHISSLTVAIPHLANSSAVRSSRLLLASLPSQPSLKHPVVPQVTVKTVEGNGWIQATYSNKQQLKIDTAGAMSVEELFRKVTIPRGKAADLGASC